MDHGIAHPPPDRINATELPVVDRGRIYAGAMGSHLVTKVDDPRHLSRRRAWAGPLQVPWGSSLGILPVQTDGKGGLSTPTEHAMGRGT